MADGNIYTASHEYATRPADERFPSFAALIAAADADRDACAEARYNLRDLRATVNGEGARRTVTLASPNGEATLTHYSFGQLLKTIGGPFSKQGSAALLRTLPPEQTRDALNFGIQDVAATGTRANILIRDADPTRLPTVRACTSETYGRVWDGALYGEVNRWFGDGMRSNGGQWQTPPTWDASRPGGNYRGDRDSFVIRVDGGSIVDDPRGWSAKGQNGGRLHRGIMIRNSEVGECSVTVECILFDVICGNHILWGAMIDRQFKRRHVGDKITRDTMNELLTIARRYNQRSADQDTKIIRALVQHEIAADKPAVIDELRKMGATKEEATEAYATAEEKEPSFSPRSFWGLAAGLTRNSQESGYEDERLQLDSLAAAILKKGAAQYVTV